MPRPRETSPSLAGIGAVMGNVFGGPGGAAMGGGLSGLFTTSALALEQALQQKLSSPNLRFESLRRTSLNEIHILCRDAQGRWHAIIAKIEATNPQMDPDARDDALYDAAVVAIDKFTFLNCGDPLPA